MTLPNLFYWINLRQVWRDIVFRAAMRRIEDVNSQQKKEILNYVYTDVERYPVTDTEKDKHLVS